LTIPPGEIALGRSGSGSLIERIRERGALTVAAFMDLALYDPQFGYYARAPRRSGRAGDFFTSVDVGPLFGELLAGQIAEMADLLPDTPGVQLVEAGAGNARLTADILRALRTNHRAQFDRIRVDLVEASATARAAQRATLADLADRLDSSSHALPPTIEGVLVANELLDAFPVHQVVMRAGGLREVYVGADGDRLTTVEGPPSTPALGEYLERAGVSLRPGWRAEINLRARGWIAEAAARLRRGFMILIDYGHEARELFGVSHSTGTLTTFSRHTTGGESRHAAEPIWLQRPGEQDLTSHVDFTTLRAEAESHGLTTLGFLDQTYFLLALVDDTRPLNLSQRLALKTLLLPGGLGSTMKVLVLGSNVGRPALRGCSYRMRVT
jgi:SAM-dependent MidA family methyltransferase